VFRRKLNKISFYLGFVCLFQVFVMPFIIPKWLGDNETFCWVNVIIFLTFLFVSNKAGERLNNPTLEEIRDEKIDDILK
jgi:hypothetical protein